MPEPEPVAVIGAGPAGIATALALHKVGLPVALYERHPEPRPAGNILNLWPPAIKALADIGVDVDDIGAPCDTTFRSADDRMRAHVNLRPEIVRDYGGGFIGMIRPDLYARMLAALPDGTVRGRHELTSLTDHGDGVTLTFSDGEACEAPLVVGADGINSTVRRLVWGETPIREHHLHVIGGYTFDLPEGVSARDAVVRHSRTVQGSRTGIRSHGRDGAEWWFLEAWRADEPAPTDLRAHVLELARQFPSDLAALVHRTTDDHITRWQIRDRGKPPAAWWQGRVVLAGDAVHSTSPYAAYGAGMSIVDGFFLAQGLHDIDLSDPAALAAALQGYQDHRLRHTTEQVQAAYVLGRVFHHLPAPLRPLRDAVFDHTPVLQKQVGDRNPTEISAQLDEMGADLFHPAGRGPTGPPARPKDATP